MQGTIGLVAAFDYSAGNSALGRSNFRADLSWPVAFSPGTGAGQANRVFAATRALTASQTESLDLNGGGLVDPNGAPLNFTAIKAIAMRAAASNAGSLTVGGAPSNGWQGPFSASTGAVVLAPGEVFCVTNQTAAGWSVTPGTGDILRIVNGAAASAAYDIVLIGVG